MRATEAGAEKPVNVRAGNIQIRLAESPAEVRAAQALRYRVFCEEMGSKSTAEMTAARREFDSFDAHCEHLLVFDMSRAGRPESVVATYRMMRREAAEKRGQFYSSDEYDITKLIEFPGDVLEVGRSCVHPDFRRGLIMQLLWRGIAEYVFYYDIEILFGCASLPGTDPDANALPLAYLYHKHLAPPELRVRALPERYVDMRRTETDAIDEAAAKAVLPLVRPDGFIPGRIDTQGRGQDSTCCLTGNCQLSIVWAKLHQSTGASELRDAAVSSLRYVMKSQDLDTQNLDIRGAIKGSHPVWGRYSRLTYPNWPTKFFIDAMLLCESWMS